MKTVNATSIVIADADGFYDLTLLVSARLGRKGTWVKNDDTKEFVEPETIFRDRNGGSILRFRLQLGSSYFARETWGGVTTDTWIFVKPFGSTP